MGIFLGITLLLAPVIPSFYIGFYTSLAFNVAFYYFLNRSLFPKIIYSHHFFKEYFLGILLVVILFESIGFVIMPFDVIDIGFLANQETIENYAAEELFLYNYLVEFNAPFIGLFYLKILLFYISWRIQGFIFKEQYKAYRIKDFILSKPDNKEKYVSLTLGIFFTLSNIDVLPFMINVGDRELLIPIFRMAKLLYQYFTL